ncbi:MAG: hypothetical protein D6741_10910 [Planctomycetota bacterium]|nr:MAG: hypothetical protein D6741_10910 [Planctomycetota bacterium]
MNSILLAAVGVVLTVPSASMVLAQSMWELTPYKIRLVLAADDCVELEPALKNDVLPAVVTSLDYAAAARWEISGEICPPELRSVVLGDWKSLDKDLLPEEWRDPKQWDKIILVVVSQGIDGLHLKACDWDVALESFGVPVDGYAPDASQLSEAVEATVRRAFTPQARIAVIEPDAVQLRLRAGALPARDDQLGRVEAGAIFESFVRYEDRFGKARAIMRVPWSYLYIDRVDDGGKLISSVYSGLRNAFSARRRGRVRQITRLVRPQQGTTRLVLFSPGEEKTPLVGYDIYAKSPGEEHYQRIGRTDFQGVIEIAPVDVSPLRELIVKHGSRQMARLPLVPGLEPVLEAALPNDDQRLAAEGYLIGVQDELMDLVTRRTLLLARARRALENGDFETADRLLSEARALKTREQFVNELTQQQKLAVCDDPASQRRVDAMFDEIKKLVVQFLDPSEVESLTQQLAQARRNK